MAPIYEFICSNCNLRFEKVYNINQEKYPICPNPFCGCNKIWRVFNSNPPIFRGTGYYIKDSKNK